MMFATQYPFDKLDMVLAPQFYHDAMENAACIVFKEEIVPSIGEIRTRKEIENDYLTLLHEISH